MKTTPTNPRIIVPCWMMRGTSESVHEWEQRSALNNKESRLNQEELNQEELREKVSKN